MINLNGRNLYFLHGFVYLIENIVYGALLKYQNIVFLLALDQNLAN